MEAREHVGPQLSEAQVRQYREEGLVIPDYRLPEAELAGLHRALDELLADNPGLRPESLDVAHVKSGGTVRGNDLVLEIARHPDILDLVEQVIGPDIILWNTHMWCKPAGDGKEIPWHQDGHYWPIRPIASCSVWIALDASTPENGAMRYIPGSHLQGLSFKHHTDSNDALALNQALDAGQIDEAQARDVVLEPGQMSLHDVNLVHGSPPNRSTKRRAGLALRYMPATSFFDHGLRRPELTADFSRRPLWLVRGEDRAGNDLTIGHDA